MATIPLVAVNGKAYTIKKTFSRETSITIEIKAELSIVWDLLTNASDYPRWNSTIISIEGNIAAGEKIKLKSTLDPKRTFTLTVKELEPQKKLVWGDGLGTRTYTLYKNEKDSSIFSIKEKIGGAFFPLFASKIPSFDASFEQFAADLKKEAQNIMNARNR